MSIRPKFNAVIAAELPLYIVYLHLAKSFSKYFSFEIITLGGSLNLFIFNFFKKFFQY